MSEHIRPDAAETDSGFQGDFLKNLILSFDFILVNRGKVALLEKKTEGRQGFYGLLFHKYLPIGVHVSLTPAQPLAGWAELGVLFNSLEPQIPHLLESVALCRVGCCSAQASVGTTDAELS